uniref:N-acetylmuramidase/lysin n=1 Tax=uncultured Alphaproteobacteria bacterium TaxID=91750 RepID=A0A1B0Z1Z4_9PROT|nr:N-acetylmuramidase/lysin [uncultured Alphaproteobacteria bacterium]ANO58413.1 N-acetylmuramidase/lysin [uncultured Alphaproteobacteria bacterium]
MFALVQDNTITKTLSGNRGITLGDIQYPRSIYTLWSAAEREAIGIYEVVFDNTNKKDEAYYNNTNQSFAFAGGVVTASYGSATAKALADANATDEDGVELDPVVVIDGLKTKHKRIIKQQASGLLIPTDWYVIKATDVESYSVPSAITTFRANVRTKSNDMEVLIDACSTVDELAALYEYVNTGTEENPVMERPLGEFPEAV